MYILDVDVSVDEDMMYAIVSAFQCYTISVDVYFPYYRTLWMACFTVSVDTVLLLLRS